MMTKLLKKLILFITISILSFTTVSSTYASIFDFFNFTKKAEENIVQNNDDQETLALSDTDTKNIYGEAELEVEKVINDIFEAIKGLDFKKVVSLSDYNGSYDTRYIDQFFDKYSGSEEIVRVLLDTVKIDIKDIEKVQNDTYKVWLNIEMIDLNKLVNKISIKVGMDIVASKFKASENGNDIINIILKRIAEVINKDSYEKINFEYNVELIKISETYKLSTKKIINDVENWIQAIMPFFEKRQ